MGKTVTWIGIVYSAGCKGKIITSVVAHCVSERQGNANLS